MYEALNLTMCEIKAFIAKPSCAISALLRCYAALSGNSLPNFGTACWSHGQGSGNPKERTEHD
jgi:hypothetical protein